MKHPDFLYRYRPVIPPDFFAVQEIEYNTVYLCPLDKLNDPREGGFRYEPSNVETLRQQLVNMALEDGKAEIALLLHLSPDEIVREIDHGDVMRKVRATWSAGRHVRGAHDVLRKARG